MSAAIIHPTAVIDPKARLDEGVSVGPFTVIGADVEIGAGTTIGSHGSILGPTRIGRDNVIHAHASLGGQPQDKKHKGEPTRLEIGDRNTIFEFTTFSRGTVDGGGVTTVGSDNWIMAYAHVAHDVVIGNHCILANNATLAGHVVVEDWAILGGFAVFMSGAPLAEAKQQLAEAAASSEDVARMLAFIEKSERGLLR